MRLHVIHQVFQVTPDHTTTCPLGTHLWIQIVQTTDTKTVNENGMIMSNQHEAKIEKIEQVAEKTRGNLDERNPRDT